MTMIQKGFRHGLSIVPALGNAAEWVQDAYHPSYFRVAR